MVKNSVIEKERGGNPPTVIERLFRILLASGHIPHPRTVYVEPVGNLCQLRCPLCPVGRQKLQNTGKVMSMESFQRILDKIPFVRTLELYRSGEPFLNPELCGMIRYASDRRISVIISTHFSFAKPDRFFEEIVDSGLKRLVVSLDGASQKSYQKYRRGGDFAQVVSNIEKLAAAKKRRSSDKPEIVWQFLVNKFNEHEIPAAREMARKLEVSLDLRPLSLADNEPDVVQGAAIEQRKSEWLPQNEAYISECYRGEYRSPLMPGICTDLFTRMVVTADGSVLPCCEVWDERNNFGNLLEQSFDEIWSGPKYRDARARFLIAGFQPRTPSICFGCQNFGTATSAREKLRLLLTVYRRAFRFW